MKTYTNADLKISLDLCIHMKEYPESFTFWIQTILELFTREIYRFNKK